MSGKKKVTTICLFIAAVFFAGPGIAGESCITGQCHQNLQKAKFTHPAAETCDMCHQRVLAPHPQVSSGMCMECHNLHSGEPKLLAKPVKDLCASCHPETSDYKFVHGPAATGDCRSEEHT